MGVKAFYHILLWFYLSDSSLPDGLRFSSWIRMYINDLAGSWSGKALDLYSEGSRFESRPSYPLCCPILSMVRSVPPDECCYSTTNNDTIISFKVLIHYVPTLIWRSCWEANIS
jgi:hypothetical protein